MRRAARRLRIDRPERRLGGVVHGVLWILGGVTLCCYPLLPGGPRGHVGLVIALAAAAVVWGLCALLIVPWRHAPALLVQGSTATAMIAEAGVVALTGGSQSSAWIYFFWTALYAAYFFERPVAVTYLVLCIAGQSLPLVYDHRVLHDGFLPELIVSSVGILTLGCAVIAGRALLRGLRDRAELIADEQAALRRVATAVVGGADPEGVYRTVAREVAGLLGASAGGVLQLRDEGDMVLTGIWVDGSVLAVTPGLPVPIRSGRDLDRAIATRAAVRTDDHPSDSFARVIGCAASIVAPVMIGERIWGLVLAGSTRAGSFEAVDEQRLSAFCALLATAVEHLEDRARLAAEALTDPLTGLSNHRALQQQLATALARSERSGRTLSVAMLDVDHFKAMNDTGGHAAGDEVLRNVASALRSVARAQDVVGRAGGDEFMWILPDTDAAAAGVAVERARSLIARTAGQPIVVTTSAGIADTSTARDGDAVVRRADLALYTSKAAGRNRITVDASGVASGPDGGPDPAPARSAGGRLDRAEALAGLRALARAIDAKDPATHEHSERVAAFVGRLAEAAGWGERRVALLREAALVHDVGKLAVPDVLLSKPGRLTHRERTQMSEHAELSARIVGSVLSDEQVSWIRFHHERPDGCGYPCGVTGEAIPDGAALIAVADAFDVMTVGRTYSARRSVPEALDECRALAGAQFTHDAVAALLALDDEGELEGTGEPHLLAGLSR